MGIDARFDEDTPDSDMYPKIDAWNTLPADKKELVARTLMKKKPKELNEFMGKLEMALKRTIKTITILPLSGTTHTLSTISDAIDFIKNYKSGPEVCEIIRYEVRVTYNNDSICGEFEAKESAIKFLEQYKLEL